MRYFKFCANLFSANKFALKTKHDKIITGELKCLSEEMKKSKK